MASLGPDRMSQISRELPSSPEMATSADCPPPVNEDDVDPFPASVGSRRGNGVGQNVRLHVRLEPPKEKGRSICRRMRSSGQANNNATTLPRCVPCLHCSFCVSSWPGSVVSPEDGWHTSGSGPSGTTTQRQKL